MLFLKFIDQNFPNNNPLSAIINRKTVKISYSVTNNIGKIMQTHNKKIIKNETLESTSTRPCNCRNKQLCPVESKCCTKCVIYKATVNQENKKAEYIGNTEGEFKLRYNQHTHSFRDQSKKSATTLSHYIWHHKLNPTPPIKWQILKKCAKYQPGQGPCDLCLSEKLFIVKNLTNPKNLNKRTDIGNKCVLHTKKHRLDHFA